MEFTALQILPPKDWGRFEDLCRCLFAAVWGDPYTQKNGRTGQPQHGVDVWGRACGPHAGTHCVQCKGKDANYGGKVTIADFDAELAKAEHFQPEPAYWFLATTAPTDGALQEHARVPMPKDDRLGSSCRPVRSAITPAWRHCWTACRRRGGFWPTEAMTPIGLEMR